MKAKQLALIIFIFIFIGGISCSQSGMKKRKVENDDNDNPEEVIVENDDEMGPEIILTKPVFNTRGLVVVPEKVRGKIKIEGTISDESGVSTDILINGSSFRTDGNGNFECRIASPSNSKIVIEASDKIGNKTTKSFDIPKPKPKPIRNDLRRVAFVIGNADYTSATKLKNPINDVNSISKTLKALGFEVYTYKNLDLNNFKNSITDFENKISKGSVSLFYFAGHGIQSNGINYLIPIDANPQYEEDFEIQCININSILKKLKKNENNANIVILDACRNNPFTTSETTNSGLAMMSAPLGTFIAFAADANQVALDGDGNNGLFTQELLNNMKTQGIKIEDVFKRTRKAVSEKSGGIQEPTDYSKLTVDFYFKK